MLYFLDYQYIGKSAKKESVRFAMNHWMRDSDEMANFVKQNNMYCTLHKTM